VESGHVHVRRQPQLASLALGLRDCQRHHVGQAIVARRVREAEPAERRDQPPRKPPSQCQPARDGVDVMAPVVALTRHGVGGIVRVAQARRRRGSVHGGDGVPPERRQPGRQFHAVWVGAAGQFGDGPCPFRRADADGIDVDDDRGEWVEPPGFGVRQERGRRVR
jgi:hypothetical protein